MQGILLVDKPKTWTSFDVVNFVRKIVANAEGKKPKNTKVGHCGTLDPLATGLLVLVIGKEYTTKAGEFSKQDKIYEVTMKLGETSRTGDDEGEKSSVSDTIPAEKAIQEALQAFTGQIMQVPPQFSAVKVDGRRAYKAAREGKSVEIKPRPVTIYENKFTSYEYPYVTFVSHVGSGTYIRSLVEDLGKHLNTGAYMSDLRRTAIGDFDVADAVQIDGINEEIIQKALRD